MSDARQLQGEYPAADPTLSAEQILTVVATLREHFRLAAGYSSEYPAHAHLNTAQPDAPVYAARHCYRMLDRIEDWVQAGHFAKAERDVCFIQGVLWACGHFTRNELDDMYRLPDKA